jgi:hypothetical protein
LLKSERERLRAAFDRLRLGLSDYWKTPLSKTQRQERERLVAAIARLRLPELKEYPDLPELARKAILQGRVYRSYSFTQPFWLPKFRITEQSKEEWEREADELYLKYRVEEWRKCHVYLSVDEPVAELRKRRGSGKTGRNASTDERYEWAALRWLGLSWKSIAGLCLPCRSKRALTAAVSTVEKAATEILRSAGFENQLPDLKIRSD